MDIGRIKGLARDLKGEIIEMRRHIHMRPEISWHEAETSSFIESKLIGLKLDNIKKGFGGTDSGVTAELSGDPSGPCVALRADIDALPINEENALEHRSRNKGAMHACGHDGHTAALLGAAKILSSMKEAIPGKIRFIFQPAEEIGAPSGAQVMIAEGALDGVCMIGGMHLWSFVRTGLVQWRNGPAMASSDRLSVVFTGKGGHGAMPHTAIDPIIAVANYVLAIQTITSREINPLESAVVSIGKIDSGDTFNIIPGEARLMGSLRSFSPDVRGAMEERLRRIADGIASAYRCSAETTVAYMLPSLANDLKATEILRETAEEAVGSDNVEESAPLMVSEDFGLYLKRVPGTFFFLGAGNADKGANFPHHSPRFDIDEDALETGAVMMAAFALSAIERLKG